MARRLRGQARGGWHVARAGSSSGRRGVLRCAVLRALVARYGDG
jgi:hypothetical protein